MYNRRSWTSDLRIYSHSPWWIYRMKQNMLRSEDDVGNYSNNREYANTLWTTVHTNFGMISYEVLWMTHYVNWLTQFELRAYFSKIVKMCTISRCCRALKIMMDTGNDCYQKSKVYKKSFSISISIQKLVGILSMIWK